MKNIVALDHESNKTYAVYLHNAKFSGRQLHSGVSRNFLRHILSVIQPDVVVINKISSFNEIFGIVSPSSSIVEMSSDSLENLARTLGISVKSNEPIVTVRLLVVLFLRNIGRVVEWNNRSGTVEFYSLDRLESSHKKLLSDGLNKDLIKISGREIRKPIEFIHTYLDLGVITEYVNIGKGKEAEVFLVTLKNSTNCVIKIYYRFSSTTRNLGFGGKGRDDWRMPSALAQREKINLRWMEKHKIPVPTVIHRDGPAIFLEAFTVGDGENLLPAPSLQDVDLRMYGDPLDYFDQLMDILFLIFRDAEMVHGDFSPPNILIVEGEIKIIDAVQAHRYYFGDTMGSLISLQKAVTILRSDVESIVKHFKQKYRVMANVDDIIKEFLHGLDTELPSQ